MDMIDIIYIYACLGVCLFVWLFVVSDKRQNGWTDVGPRMAQGKVYGLSKFKKMPPNFYFH